MKRNKSEVGFLNRHDTSSDEMKILKKQFIYSFSWKIFCFWAYND